MVLSKWMRNFPCFNTRSKFKKFILFDCIWKSTKSLNFYFQVSNIGRPHPQSLIYNFIVRVYFWGQYRKIVGYAMFTAALFTIARTWKQPGCPSTDEWVKKLWYLYTMKHCSAKAGTNLRQLQWGRWNWSLLYRVKQVRKTGWMGSPTWRTGRPGMLQSMGSQRVRHDWATEQVRKGKTSILIHVSGI